MSSRRTFFKKSIDGGSARLRADPLTTRIMMGEKRIDAPILHAQCKQLRYIEVAGE